MKDLTPHPSAAEAAENEAREILITLHPKEIDAIVCGLKALGHPRLAKGFPRDLYAILTRHGAHRGLSEMKVDELAARFDHMNQNPPEATP